MGAQGSTRMATLERRSDRERRRFQANFQLERPSDELAACSRPPGWDESGFPVAPPRSGFAARVWRLLER